MECGVVVEGIDRARRATLNFFTETLPGTHQAPANIMDLLMVADGPPTARESRAQTTCSMSRRLVLEPSDSRKFSST